MWPCHSNQASVCPSGVGFGNRNGNWGLGLLPDGWLMSSGYANYNHANKYATWNGTNKIHVFMRHCNGMRVCSVCAVRVCEAILHS